MPLARTSKDKGPQYTIEDLAKEVRLYTGVSEEKALLIVRAIFGAVIKGLKEDGNVRINTFGTFFTKVVGRHPFISFRTNKKIQYPPWKVVKFRNHKALRYLIDPGAYEQGET
jgi:nucleoid DNA-binding protein